MYLIGKCGAKIEVYGDPDNEVIVQCAMGRSMCCDHATQPGEICNECSYEIED